MSPHRLFKIPTEINELRQIFTVFLMLFTCAGCDVFAKEKSRNITVGVFEISSLLNNNESDPGPYNKILNEFSTLDTFLASPARVDLLFAQKKIDCLFPASTATMPSPQNYISSKPVNITKAYIFSIEPYSSLNEFEGKVLAIRRGLSIGNIRTKFNADYANINSDAAMVRFLHKERADGMVAYLADAKAAYKSLDLAIDFYQESIPVHTSEDAIVCHKNAFTQAKIASFNRTIDKLKTSGKLQRILSNSL